MPDAPPLACFDLDGTIVDSRGPFAACVNGALADLGLPERRPEDLHRFLGPPFEQTAATFLADAGRSADDAAIEQLMGLYRGRLARDGLRATPVVPGVPDALDALRADGWALVVVTSKIRPFAVEILEHVGLQGRFEDVLGPAPEDRGVPKSRTLRAVLADRPHHGAVMIGDRHHDLDAAAACGIPGVGVTWAGDHAEELHAAGAVAVLGDPAELPEALRAAIGR